MSGHRDATSGLAEVTWERTVRDTGAVTRLADSLGTAFVARGLRARTCPAGGRRWESAAMGVQFNRLPPGPGGRPRVVVFATTLPAALPDLFCPRWPGARATT